MTIEQLKLNGWKDNEGHLWNDPTLDYFKIYESGEVCINNGYNYRVPGWFINLSSDMIADRTSIHRILKSGHRNFDEFAARFIINAPEIPKCKTCGTNLQFRGHGRLFGKYCCNSCVGKDPDNRKLHSDMMKDFNNNLSPEKRCEMLANSEWSRIYYQNKCDYGFYIASMTDGIKFGAIKGRDYIARIRMQIGYNQEQSQFIKLIPLYYADNKTIANLEWYVKEKFGFREYLDWNELPKLIKVIRKLSSEYKLNLEPFKTYRGSDYH